MYDHRKRYVHIINIPFRQIIICTQDVSVYSSIYIHECSFTIDIYLDINCI